MNEGKIVSEVSRAETTQELIMSYIPKSSKRRLKPDGGGNIKDGKSTFDLRAFIQKYTMIIALVVVVVFFSIITGGKLILPQNISNLIAQNALRVRPCSRHAAVPSHDRR